MSSAARIEELQKKFDENPRRYFAPLANECRKAGELDAAIAICRAHLPQQPGHMSGHIVYGQALYESGELAEAKSVFETALALDPENLIALRHMGDIAARGGDAAEARQWYVRVLETDPRNEEIQALLSEMGGAPSGIGGGDASAIDVVEGLPSLLDPELLAAAADAGQPAEPAFAEPAFAEPAFAEPPDRRSDHTSEPLLVPTTVDGADRDAHAPSGNLDGFEATSFEAPEPEAARAPPTPAEPTAAPELLTFEMPATEASRSVPSVPTPVAGFDATGFGATGLEPIAAAAIGGTSGDTSHRAPDALETMPDLSEAPQPADPSAMDDAFVTETMAELYLSQGYYDRALEVYRQLVAQQPADAALRSRMERVEAARATAGGGSTAVPEVEDYAPAPPSIPGLPTALEPSLIAAAADAAELTGDQQWGGDTASSGPTIREFLTALAYGQSVAASAPSPGVADTAAHDFGDPLADHASPPDYAPLPDATPLPAGPPGGEVAEIIDLTEASGPLGGIPLMQWDEDDADESPAATSTVDDIPTSDPSAGVSPPAGSGGGLDRLFGAPANMLDVRAADILRDAYTPRADVPPASSEDPAGMNPLSGKPARPAGNDLSLDSVFGGQRQAGAGRGAGGFSFDQFFSDGAVKGPREESHEPSAAEGDSEDLEQFNSWLHGLKNQ